MVESTQLESHSINKTLMEETFMWRTNLDDRSRFLADLRLSFTYGLGSVIGELMP